MAPWSQQPLAFCTLPGPSMALRAGEGKVGVVDGQGVSAQPSKLTSFRREIWPGGEVEDRSILPFHSELLIKFYAIAITVLKGNYLGRRWKCILKVNEVLLF